MSPGITKHMIPSGDGVELIALKEAVFATRKPLLPALPILNRPFRLRHSIDWSTHYKAVLTLTLRHSIDWSTHYKAVLTLTLRHSIDWSTHYKAVLTLTLQRSTKHGSHRHVTLALQGEHKVFPWLQIFITRNLRGIQTYFFLPLLDLVSKIWCNVLCYKNMFVFHAVFL